MALNLRTITPELHHRLKLAAFSSGKALERFCLDALDDCLNGKWSDPPSAKPVFDSKIGRKGIDRDSYPPRTSHDPATCRIYKCGMCAVVKGA